MTHRIVAAAHTPRSPVPRATRAGPISRVTKNPMLLTASAIGLVAVGFLGAKMLLDSRAQGVSAPEVNAPPQVVAESTRAPVTPTPPPDSTSARQNELPKVTPPNAQRRVESPAPGRNPAPTAAASAGRRESTHTPVQQRAESSVTPVQQKAETTRTLPPIVPPPVTSAAVPNQPPAPIARPSPTAAEEVTAVIQSYARALASSDMAAARRIYVNMPEDQRRGLAAVWSSGGTMAPNWSVASIVVDGDVATARVTGSTVVTPRGAPASTVPVSLRARLERRDGAWRLVALVN
jgi:hypothetical protein